MKTCNACHETKLLTEFHSNGYNSAKEKVYKPDCKECANVKWNVRYREMLDGLVAEIFGEWKCSECQYDTCIRALSFHHLDGEDKDFTVASRWTISRGNMEAELRKCIMLCMNCHMEVHAGVRTLGD